MSDISADLIKVSPAPAGDDAYRVWLEQKDVLSILKANLTRDDFVVYANLPNVFMHAVLVPAPLVNPPNIEDLLSWNLNPFISWGIWYDFAEPPSVGISPPLDHTGSKTIDKGEPLVFRRSFEGRIGDRNYTEILQKFVHVFDLHFLAERNAYCRLDKHGDIEDVIRIVEVPENGDWHGGIFVTFKRDVLDEYMAVTDSVAVMMFDFTRFRVGSFGGWPQERDADVKKSDDLSYRFVHMLGHASYLRGYQLVRPSITKEEIIRRFHHSDDEEGEGKHVSFIVQDWRHEVIAEVSCAPGQTANYFNADENDLPYELSPAFFRPEVLSKYKADSEKYQVDDRTISCRGAWSLQTYDINEEGQVHTYLVYLRSLPYEEQLYWKAYNEKPKGPISKRAFATDFEGSWNLEYDPLRALKNLLDELRQARVPWWTLRAQDLPRLVQYPATSSPDEWSNEILRLDQLLVEGFEERWLRKKAEDLGRSPEKQFRSLKLIEECLIAFGFEEEHAREITSPLHEIHNLRSKLKGHASGDTVTSIKRKVLAEHKTYRRHFHELCKAADESLQSIREAFRDPRFAK